MAEGREARPSVEGIFRVLAGIPRERLVGYKHKLNCARHDRKSRRLLQAMILLSLGREDEARVSLGSLGDEATAAHVYRSHRGSADAKGAGPAPPEQEAEVALAVAQIYSLLVEQEWCGPLARDEAYRAAIEAHRAGNGPQMARLSLGSLLAEARDKCGLDFAPGAASSSFGAPRSDTRAPPARQGSCPVPVPDPSYSLDPKPLRSTSTLASLASHFEISQSPTVPYLTEKPHGSDSGRLAPRSHEGVASLEAPAASCSENPGESPLQGGIGSGFEGRKSNPSVLPDPEASHAVEEGVGHPVECTEPPSAELQDPKGAKPPNVQASSTPQGGSAPTGSLQSPGGGPSSSAPSAGPEPLSSFHPAPLASPSDPQGDEGKFFTFVVLHASEDEAVARRVKERLEDLGVSDGATFSEEFLVPGHCQLACFQNALDNSAFTLILLTQNFRSRLCRHQVNVALMDSFTRLRKTHTVIPFVPKERPAGRGEVPGLLAGLVPLDENSPVFARRVQKTFTPAAIQERRAAWSYAQEIRKREKQWEQHHDYLQVVERLAALGIPAQAPVLNPVPPRGFPGAFFPPTFPAPARPQPVPAQPPPPFAASLGPPSVGPQPQFIIQHAQMVQIGDYNQMQVDRTAALSTVDGEAGGNP